LNVLLSVSQWEREVVAERTASAMQHKRRHGERISRDRFGYDIVGEKLVENAAEQSAIKLMLKLRRDGHTYRAIASELDGRGIKRKRAARWSHQAVQVILSA